MTEKFINDVMKTAVAVLCQNMGWNSAQLSSIDVLADIWKRQFLQIGKAAHRNAEHCGRSQVTLDDAMLAFSDMGISMPELEEYIHNFDPVSLPYKLPNFPYPKQSHLNCLRPGSEEVLTRPVHIHEYMPPWNSEEKKDSGDILERETSAAEAAAATEVIEMDMTTAENGDVEHEKGKTMSTDASKDKEGEAPESPTVNGTLPTTPPKSTTKRMESHNESPALKRVRMMLEEEGHPLRQVSSVIMTTSGFLTSSREGRLPDTRPPKNRDFFEALPPPPPEKKKKIPTMKKIVEGVKRIDKERDLEGDGFDLFGNPDKIITLSNQKEGGETNAKSKYNSLKKDRREKDPSRRDKYSSSKKDKGTENKKKDRHKIDSRRMGDRKFLKLPDRELKEKLNIFKKNMMMKKSDKLAKKARRLKMKRQREAIEEEEEDDDDLDDISSEDNFGDESELVEVQPDIGSFSSSSKKRSRDSSDHQHLTVAKKARTKEKSPLTIALPKVSPKFKDMAQTPGFLGEVAPKKKRGRPRKIIPPGGLPPMPPLTSPYKLAKLSKKLKQTFGMDALIPEISISKPPPPPLDFSKMIGRLPNQPGLIPTNYAPPPSRKSANLPPSISITPATPSISGMTTSPLTSKGSLTLPSSLCSSVTITRIDMPNSQKLPTPYEKGDERRGSGISITPQIPGHGQKSSSNSSNIQIQADANSGITITPIVMEKSNSNSRSGMETIVISGPGPEKEGSGRAEKGSVLAKLEEDMRTKEQRRKDREKRKELKKEKKKERKEKDRNKGVGGGEKVDRKERKDKEKKKKVEIPAAEGVVPKITLKLSNANTPVDSPNPPVRVLDDRVDTPPPLRKFSIKPIEEFAKKRTPSPEHARFSPLVTRPPKSNKVSPTAQSSSNETVSFPPSLNSKRGPGRPPKSGRGPGRPPKSQAGLITETVGYYIDDQGTKVWICPSCGRQDDGSPMIGCDNCDDWHHFTCVGITDTPDETESWFCTKCEAANAAISKSSGGGSTSFEHRKKGPKL